MPETQVKIDQLVVVLVSGDQINDLMQNLVRGRFYFTLVNSTGGFLERATSCLLIGIPASRYPRLLQVLSACCKTRRTFIPARIEAPTLMSQPLMMEAEIGGATIFQLEVERFEQF